MKRVWLVLLALGLIAAFSTQAVAVDLRWSGEYYAAGMYQDRTGMIKDGSPSTAFYYQRLRLNTTFIVHPGLFVIARADIMERAWGAARTAPGTGLDTMSSGTRAENENIAFDLLYAMYVNPLGIIQAGYMIDGVWGTTFGDNSVTAGKVVLIYRGGPFRAGIQAGKVNDGERSAGTWNGAVGNASDRDNSFYTAFGDFTWKTGQVGLLAKHHIFKAGRGDTVVLSPSLPAFPFDSSTRFTVLSPYAKAQLGPVAVQAQVYYAFGSRKWEDPGAATARNPAVLGTDEVKLSQLSAWVDALADLGMFYAGGSLAYVSGDDFSTRDKAEGGILTGGMDWNPTLIMFNSDRTYWAGGLAGANGAAINGPMSNAYFVQVRGGVRPIEKLDIGMSVSYAHADKALSAQWEGRDYGYEVDLTATYKITNNLSYMLGGGYLYTGKYLKGTSGANEVENNFLVINKLTVTF
jgi:hypothetical protein